MTQRAVLEYLEAMWPRCLKASKAGKGRILVEVCVTTGLHRKSAIRRLRRPGVRVERKRGRPRRYGPEVADALGKVWELCDLPCGKLLGPVPADMVEAFERHGEVTLSERVRGELLAMSPAAIDRQLGRRRSKHPRQPRIHSPARGSLRAQIPIRTFGEWQGVEPGALQADRVLQLR